MDDMGNYLYKTHHIENNGNEYWRKSDQLHRDDGGPSVIWTDGTEFWNMNQGLHRDKNPAVIYVNGREYYALEGRLLFKHDLKNK